MNENVKIVMKRFWFSVTAERQAVSKTFEVDKNLGIIRGILFHSQRDDLLYYRGSQKVEINKEEFFPENYDTKLLMSGINVPPNQRFWDLGRVPSGNRSIKIDFLDTPDGRTVFAPYTVILVVMCEMTEP